MRSSTAVASAPQNDSIGEVARRLDQVYGPHRWSSHGPPVDELIATILSQHTSDVNTDRAFAALKARFPRWDEVIAAPTADLTDAIRSGGLANLKAPRIKAVLTSIRQRYDGYDLRGLSSKSVTQARAELVELNGVGPKTASCVLLFSLGMPAMPVDTHVHRVAQRVGLISKATSADAAHNELERQLGENRDEVYAFHLNMIAHGRSICLARRPRCERCPLTECCDYYTHQGDWQLPSH